MKNSLGLLKSYLKKIHSLDIFRISVFPTLQTSLSSKRINIHTAVKNFHPDSASIAGHTLKYCFHHNNNEYIKG